jgi:hypothetical protein
VGIAVADSDENVNDDSWEHSTDSGCEKKDWDGYPFDWGINDLLDLRDRRRDPAFTKHVFQEETSHAQLEIICDKEYP